ncbi:hypothetical protein [Elizabethkingia meningoseptica]|uniref:hypothetical protein n=1 Tax=Elizabethkingia meningoseptica TaxID=238 RepID=UPI0009999730|nr:hypothetical protein [Elizabethkingia meningoseptica]MCL1674239.1 hypothetical protein [Elizabethkingia meningoseptica]MCL1688051.1 hypothetical protein [Elizabethkingia meningoseptica]MDE5491004.1 hypothetical protein [Elizabethkingia meningoseptica]OPB95154.1 hypothetical protein BAS10_12360 [Elizabethkingia meningoseptica]
MKTQEKKNYDSPCILSVIEIELEQGLATSSSTMSVGGAGTTTPEVTDWNEQTEQNQTIDL